MKKLLLILLSALMLFSLCACGKVQNPETSSVQIANPFVRYESLEEAEKIAGFSFEVPEIIGDYKVSSIELMNSKMYNVIYTDKSENRIIIRKQAGYEDISGDYNFYADEKVEENGSVSVTIKGNEGLYSLATWIQDGYFYSVSYDVPVSLDEVGKLVPQIR